MIFLMGVKNMGGGQKYQSNSTFFFLRHEVRDMSDPCFEWSLSFIISSLILDEEWGSIINDKDQEAELLPAGKDRS